MYLCIYMLSFYFDVSILIITSAFIVNMPIFQPFFLAILCWFGILSCLQQWTVILMYNAVKRKQAILDIKCILICEIKRFSAWSELDISVRNQRNQRLKHAHNSVTRIPKVMGHFPSSCWKLKFGLHHFVCKTHFDALLPSDICRLRLSIYISYAR